MNKIFRKLTGSNIQSEYVKKPKRTKVTIHCIANDGEVLETFHCNKGEIDNEVERIFITKPHIKFVNVIQLNGHIKAANREEYLLREAAINPNGK